MAANGTQSHQRSACYCLRDRFAVLVRNWRLRSMPMCAVNAVVTQGNMQGFGGPLQQSFIDAQYYLQLRILNVSRAYGMINVRVLK